MSLPIIEDFVLLLTSITLLIVRSTRNLFVGDKATWREKLPNVYYITRFKQYFIKKKGLDVALNVTLSSP